MCSTDKPEEKVVVHTKEFCVRVRWGGGAIIVQASVRLFRCSGEREQADPVFFFCDFSYKDMQQVLRLCRHSAQRIHSE